MKEAKTNPEVRKDIMMQEAKEQYFIEKGFKKGFKRGRGEIRKDAIRKAVKMFKKVGLSDEVIRHDLLEEYPEYSDLIKKIIESE